MEYIRNTTDFHIAPETVVSLGKFDGIHRGHGYLLEYLEEMNCLTSWPLLPSQN